MREGPKSLRILVVAPTPFFADRGCHVRILGEIRALNALGHVTTVCTYHLGADLKGISTVRTLRIPWYNQLSAGPSAHKFYLDVLLLWKVLRTARSFQPDIIHAHLHEGIVIGKIASFLFRIPMVADLQGSLTDEILDHKFIPEWTWLVRSVRWIEKQINRMPHRLVASSNNAVPLANGHCGAGPSRVVVVEDGVDHELFYPRPRDPVLRTNLGIGPDDRVVVFIGVLSQYQGIDLLLECIPQVLREASPVKFLILGYPDREYRQRAKRLGVERDAIFTGRIPFAEAPRYLALGDIAVSPKISQTEANQKLFAYMAMGLPAVVFDNPVNREILGELGVYADDMSAAAFAAAIVRLLKDERRARELGEAGFQRASAEYTWESAGRKLERVYRRLDGDLRQLKSREHERAL
jgi:glycosyltransferase involved in cell wall biosynthesis